MIKPCPFDGAQWIAPVSVQSVTGGYAAVCASCGAYGPTATDETAAVQAWNGADPATPANATKP